jgi:hypothetical protein
MVAGDPTEFLVKTRQGVLGRISCGSLYDRKCDDRNDTTKQAIYRCLISAAGAARAMRVVNMRPALQPTVGLMGVFERYI